MQLIICNWNGNPSLYERYPIFNVNFMLISGIWTIFQYYKMGMLLVYIFENNEKITKFYVITKTMEFFLENVITRFNGCEQSCRIIIPLLVGTM